MFEYSFSRWMTMKTSIPLGSVLVGCLYGAITALWFGCSSPAYLMPHDSAVEEQDTSSQGGTAGVERGLTRGDFAGAGLPTGSESSEAKHALPVACSVSCELPHASADCRSGVCSLLRCEDGWADCDREDANGCEANLATSVKNCGECQNVCRDATNGTAVCQAGKCSLSNCVAPYGDCDGNPSNGCESNGDTDVKNCGGCGVACQLPHAIATCADRSCAVRACEDGWADCNGFAADGCEVQILSSLSHCGACRASCAPASGVGECRDGECQIARCDLGKEDCNQAVIDGCETELLSDPANCGGCGNRCEPVNGTPSCQEGKCAIACAAGYADCDGNAANGCETDTLSDAAHCGACNESCEGRCETGTCVTWPCAGICDNPTVITIGTGAIYGLDKVVCHESYEAIKPFTSGNCGQFAAGHDLYVNDVVVPCLDGEDWGFVDDAIRPPPRHGGYCFHDGQLGNNGKSAWFSPW